jgi:hypothetical protein
MGFLLAGLGLLVLFILISVLKLVKPLCLLDSTDPYLKVFLALVGLGQ